MLRARGLGEALICNRVLCLSVVTPHAWPDTVVCSFSQFVFPMTDVSPFTSFFVFFTVVLRFTRFYPHRHLTPQRQCIRPTPCSMLCPLYMAEISPPEFRGALMAMEQFSIVLGCVLGFWLGFFTREGTCRFPCLMRYRRVVRLRRPPPLFDPLNTRLDMMTLHGRR